MAQVFHQLQFSPPIHQIIPNDARGRVVVFTGGNNSGKSAYLKTTINDPSKLYVGVNRFYSFPSLQWVQDNVDAERHQWWANMQSTVNQKYNNFEGSWFNCQTAISRLTNERRALLFQTFEQLFGTRITVESEDPRNDFSQKYVAVEGDNLSVTSSGTRLFLGILAALMDERFQTVAIDEPELGLSPSLQRKLAVIVIDGEGKDVLFPHNPNLAISTHSHLFLDKNNPANNWVVSKNGDVISARQCDSFHELHDIHFRLLGNDLSELFLPSAVILVEGETDKAYLEKVISVHLPRLRTVVQACHTDMGARLTYWSLSLGDMQLTPYRSRTFVVSDSQKQSGIDRAVVKSGMPAENHIQWSRNGIEFFYPISILRSVFHNGSLEASDLQISGDTISVGEVAYTKIDLSRIVCAAIRADTPIPAEVQDKLLDPLSRLC